MIPALLRDVVGLGTIGYVLLALPLPTLALAIVGVAAPGQAGRFAARTALATFSLSVVSAWALVHGERARFVRELGHPDPGAVLWMPLLHLFKTFVAEQFVVGSAVLCVPVLALALAVSCARRHADVWRRAGVCVLVAAFALPLWTTAWVLARAASSLAAGAYFDCDGRCHYNAVLESFALVDQGREATLSVGLLALVLGVAGGLVARGAIGWTTRVVALGTGLLGITAYAATRAEAIDAVHPLPFDDAMTWDEPDPCPLPPAPARCDGFDGVVVRWSPGHIVIDGMEASDAFATLASKRALWMALHPGRPWQGVLAVAVPEMTPMADVAPLRDDARRAGFDHALALAVRPALTDRSQTLGDFPRKRRLCATSVANGTEGLWRDRIGR